MRNNHHWGWLVGPIIVAWAYFTYFGYLIGPDKIFSPNTAVIPYVVSGLYLGFALVWLLVWRVLFYNYQGSMSNWSLRVFRDAPLSHEAPDDFSFGLDREAASNQWGHKHGRNQLPVRNRRGGIIILAALVGVVVLIMFLIAGHNTLAHAQSWTDVAPFIWFVGAVAFIIVAMIALLTERWRLVAVLLPVLGVVIYVTKAFPARGTYDLLAAFPVNLWGVLGLLAILEVLLLLGPCRVVAWAYPSGRKPRLPRPMFVVAVSLSAVITLVLFWQFTLVHGYLFFGVRAASGQIFTLRSVEAAGIGWTILGVVNTAAVFFAVAYFPLTLLYAMVMSMGSLGKQHYEARLADCGIRRIYNRPGSNRSGLYRMVSFEGDPNEYFATPGLFRELRRNIGARYSYTVTTSFFGRQFIRRRPQRLE